jgi:hypothetical protein
MTLDFLNDLTPKIVSDPSLNVICSQTRKLLKMAVIKLVRTPKKPIKPRLPRSRAVLKCTVLTVAIVLSSPVLVPYGIYVGVKKLHRHLNPVHRYEMLAQSDPFWTMLEGEEV